MEVQKQVMSPLLEFLLSLRGLLSFWVMAGDVHWVIWICVMWTNKRFSTFHTFQGWISLLYQGEDICWHLVTAQHVPADRTTDRKWHGNAGQKLFSRVSSYTSQGFSTWERLGTEPSDTVVTGRDSSSSPAAAFSRRKRGGCEPHLAGSN